MDEPNGQMPAASSSSQITFDNFVIIPELENIINNLSVSEFLEVIPKGKSKRLKWQCIFDCLKGDILDDIMQEFNSLWDIEMVNEKLKSLEEQKEKFSEKDIDGKYWRPYFNDVKKQLLVYDVADLNKQKKFLAKLVNEYKERTKELELSNATQANYIHAMQMNIEKYQKINDEIVNKIQKKLENSVCKYRSKEREANVEFSTKRMRNIV